MTKRLGLAGMEPLMSYSLSDDLESLQGGSEKIGDESCLSSMDGEISKLKYLIKTDRAFLCSWTREETRASGCLLSYRKRMLGPKCTGCQLINLAKHKKVSSKGAKPEEAKKADLVEIPDLGEFQKYTGKKCSFGDDGDKTATATLHKTIMSFNLGAVEKYGLDRYGYANLLYQEHAGIIGVQFLDKREPYSVKVSRCKKNETRVCIAGFRKQNGIEVKGRHNIFAFDDKRKILFVRLHNE